MKPRYDILVRKGKERFVLVPVKGTFAILAAIIEPPARGEAPYCIFA